MVKFKQARRAMKCRARLQTQKKKKFARRGFQASKPQSNPVVMPAWPSCQRGLFSSWELSFSRVKDTMLSIRKFSLPNLRNTTLFQSFSFTFLSVRKLTKANINFTGPPVKNAALSAKTLTFTSIRNTIKYLLMAILYVFWWCLKSLRLGFDTVKAILFPSRIYLRELTLVKQQVQKLETELSRLQEAMQNGGTLSSLERVCKRCAKLSVLDSRLPAIIPSNFLEPEAPSSVILPVLQPSLLPPLLPPPLPPPPPPPLPPSTFFMSKPVVILKKVENSKVLKDAPLKKDGPVQVTLKDLLNVKLKKTSENVEKQKQRSPKKGRSPLVRLSDLQSVNLRKNSTLPPNRITHIFISPSKGQLDLRKHLKKVNLQRSPGGTPLYDRENNDSGTGITPIMTRALKQKFQMALPKSPPENRSFEELH